jgi:hypothetical protein
MILDPYEVIPRVRKIFGLRIDAASGIGDLNSLHSGTIEALKLDEFVSFIAGPECIPGIGKVQQNVTEEEQNRCDYETVLFSNSRNHQTTAIIQC